MRAFLWCRSSTLCRFPLRLPRTWTLLGILLVLRVHDSPHTDEHYRAEHALCTRQFTGKKARQVSSCRMLHFPGLWYQLSQQPTAHAPPDVRSTELIELARTEAKGPAMVAFGLPVRTVADVAMTACECEQTRSGDSSCGSYCPTCRVHVLRRSRARRPDPGRRGSVGALRSLGR